MFINFLLFKLKKQLATEVKGKVYVSYDKNGIFVSIENSAYDIWCTEIPVLRDKVFEQKMVAVLVRIVMMQYKEHILNKYFIK